MKGKVSSSSSEDVVELGGEASLADQPVVVGGEGALDSRLVGDRSAPAATPAQPKSTYDDPVCEAEYAHFPRWSEI